MPDAVVDAIQATVDLLEAAIYLLEPTIDLLEALVDLLEAAIHLVEPAIDALREIVQPLVRPGCPLHGSQSYRIERSRYAGLCNNFAPVVGPAARPDTMGG
jgi:hypothetical protein